MQFGKSKGCEFLNLKCINNREVTFKNEFFYNIYNKQPYYDTSCSLGRQSKAYHSIHLITESVPEKYRYFEDERWGGLEPADYCPISIEISDDEDEKDYYVGHCKMEMENMVKN